MNNYQLSIKNYQLYKDSGVEWLGDVPEHWEVRRIQDLAYKIGDGLHGTPNYIDSSDFYFINGNNLIDGKIFIFESTKCISEDEFLKYTKKIGKNSILLSVNGTIGNLAFYNNESVVLGKSAAYIDLKNNINKQYVYYFLQSTKVNNFFETTYAGTTIKNLSLRTIKLTSILNPPLSEQKSIATYLDTKTAQCDRKIDLLTQKATQYGKLKQSLINETVTRGLDKSVPMKDSGVEWIGEIPEHWEIQRLHDIAVHQKTKNIGLIEKNLLSLSYGKIKRRDIDTSFGLLPESFETYQIVEEGNIILRLTDLQNDQRSLRVGLAREKGIITSAYLCLKFLRNIHPVFAYYLLFMYDISKVFYWFGGGLRQSMKFDDVKVFPFVVPPLSEQKAIADYLDKKTAQIDQIIQTINTQIEKLKELRKTLINDVVTGKIKVINN
ncbi:MAG: restriction endonuclease subunit S [Pseudanabaena sp.]